MARSFHLRILAADKDFYEGECVSLTIPITDGQLGILALHSPIAAAVIPGRLTCRLPHDEMLNAVVGHGILRFENNDALVLLDSAEYPQDVDVTRAQSAAEQAREALHESKTPQEQAQARADLARAENRLRTSRTES